MRIGIFVNEFPALSETFILNQIIGLIRSGHEVEINALRPGGTATMHGDLTRYDLLARVRYDDEMPRPWLRRMAGAARRLGRWGHRDVATTIGSLNVLRHGKAALNLSLLYRHLPGESTRRDYDVVHCHYGPNGLRAVGLRRYGALRGAIVTSFHGYDLNAVPRRDGANVYEALFRAGAAFTAGSDFMRERLLALGAPADRVVKLPMGIDLAAFPFAERRLPAGGALHLLSVARLVEVKGIRYALQAVALLKARFPGIRYVIAGDGPLRAALEQCARDLGIAGQVHFTGAVTQEQLRALHQQAHIFLLPGIVTATGEEEAQALVLAEAQASGLPVVASAIGGVPESIVPGVSGVLVPQGDVAAIVTAVTALFQRTGEWGAMGRAGRHLAESRFDAHRLNGELVEVYRQAMAGTLAPCSR